MRISRLRVNQGVSRNARRQAGRSPTLTGFQNPSTGRNRSLTFAALLGPMRRFAEAPLGLILAIESQL